MISIERPKATEDKFRQFHGYQTPVKEPFCHSVSKTAKNVVNKKTVTNRLKLTFFAFAITLRGYDLKAFFKDLISGLTVAFIRLPQGLAYGALANVPPINGLYTELWSCLLYSLFGTSRHASVGTFAVLSLMTGSLVDQYVDQSMCENGSIPVSGPENLTIPQYDEDCLNRAKSTFVVSATMLCGIIQMIMGILQFGRLSILLPRHVVQAFTTGAAFYVLTSQVRVMLGLSRIHVPRNMEIGGLFHTWYNILRKLPHSRASSAVVSIISIAVLLPTKYLSRRYKKQLRSFPLPGELFLVVIFTIICTFKPSWGSLGVIENVGEIPQGIPAPVIPNVSLWPKIIGDVFPIAIVSYTTTLSIGKLFAYKHKYRLDAMQEAFAAGISNICGSFLHCIPSAASLSRSALQEASGGMTQIVSFVSGIIVLVSLLAIGPFFSVLPKALLSAVIAVNLRGMFEQFHELKPLWNFSKVDFSVWIAGFLSVIIFGIDIGLGFAVLALIVSITWRHTRNTSMEIGRIAKTEIFRSPQRYQGASLSEFKIFKFCGAINFANAEKMMAQLPICDTVILDFSAVPYIDCIGRNLLSKTFEEFEKVAICGASDDCVTCLSLGEVTELENVTLYPTLIDAVTILSELSQSTSSSGISNVSFTEI